MKIAERLKKRYGINEPIFTPEILEELKECSRAQVFLLISKAVEDGSMVRFDNGIYYIPGRPGELPSFSVERVVEKRYIGSGGEVYGIYGKKFLTQRFGFSNENPERLEVFTNHEATDKRCLNLAGNDVILHRSRCPISSDNVGAYTLMELFNGLDEKTYEASSGGQESVKRYIRNERISKSDVLSLVAVFPARSFKKMTRCGVFELLEKGE